MLQANREVYEFGDFRRIEAIASVPGIDVLFIGASDLSYSLGVGGQRDHALVREAVSKVLAAPSRQSPCCLWVPMGNETVPPVVEWDLPRQTSVIELPTSFVDQNTKHWYKFSSRCGRRHSPSLWLRGRLCFRRLLGYF
jgi:hypothetical protein